MLRSPLQLHRPIAPRYLQQQWFDRPDLMDYLLMADKATIEDLPFEVIGFDRDRLVRIVNRVALGARRCTRLGVVGRAMFSEVGREFNNALVAGRFAASIDACRALDVVEPYVVVRFERLLLTRIRMLARQGCGMRYIAVARQG